MLHFSEPLADSIAVPLGCRRHLLPFTDFLDPVFQLITLEKNDEHGLVHVVALGPRRKTKSSEFSLWVKTFDTVYTAAQAGMASLCSLDWP